MSNVYRLKVKTEFSGAHVIHGYDGPCSRMHGHNWKVEIDVEATELDNIGMGKDFRELKHAARAVADYLDHQTLNELEPFTSVNPTAEVIAKWYFEQLEDKMKSETTRLIALTIWETDSCAVTYTPAK